MSESLKKLTQLLSEMFQLDQAELDFGIYRIMNYKREVISRFIDEDLPKAVAEELKRGSLAEQSHAVEELKGVAEDINEKLGADAVDADGNLAEEYHKTPLGKTYLALQGKIDDKRGHDALEASIFNHLYAFFSRYYQDGDFISKRRYSKREKYAIPYNGEEVYLYWANNDQYYVKTAEHFHDYSYVARGVTVHLKLTGADVEQNNVKGDRRFFVPRVKDIDWQEEVGQLIIPFEYRPLNEQEEIAYGTRNQQEKINEEAATKKIPEQLKKAEAALAALTTERHKDGDGEPVSFLEYHLRQYTLRNTSDYFIHKDLKGFLSRELDFYLKNEVLSLDELEAAGEDRSESWFQLMRVMKAIGGRVIDFLDQIESFQKLLWEKRKFVTETQYCITVGNIDERFYPEIAENEAQWEEWKELFHVDRLEKDLFSGNVKSKNGRIAFLKAHPTLVLDTRHFAQAFVDELLGSFDDLDGILGGSLLHSENFHALNLLSGRDGNTIQCVYIDPPYNTGSREFLYKDNYQHSSWLAMMSNRSALAAQLMAPSGVLFTSISDIEQAHLRVLYDKILGAHNFLADVVWQARKSVSSDAIFSLAHHHTLVYTKDRDAFEHVKCYFVLPLSQEGFENPDNDPRGPWKADPFDAPNIRPNLTYPIENPNTKKEFWPPEGRCWRTTRDEYARLLADNRIVFGKSGKAKPQFKRFWSEVKNRGRTPTTIWNDIGTTTRGTKEVQALFGFKAYDNPKPVSLIKKIGMLVENSAQFLDHYAGSGTTAHAVISLNREDAGRRKFLLVEMGNHFNAVLLPRIKKVVFTPEWNNGNPQRMATTEEAERGPRIFKYMRLESYEDALNNITFDGAAAQAAMKFDDYLLKYMLRWETMKSETLLNVEKLARPFSYKLLIHQDGGTQEKVVDVGETFNYLLGLKVKTRRVYEDEGRRYLVYRGAIDHRQVAVIWRETEGWEKEDLERDMRFIAEQKLTEGADEIFVNGDSFIPNATALEPLFKARMFAAVEV